jgi:Fic family protein
MYIYEHSDWPNFQYDLAKLSDLLADVRHIQGRLLGRMSAIGFQFRTEASLQILTQDVVKTSEIEGENLNYEQVRSSIARRLGIDIKTYLPAVRNIEGIVEVMIDATSNYSTALSEERLFAWHATLFPTGFSKMERITVGKWRNEQSGVMQVISGPMGREKIHYEAPCYDKLNEEMTSFLYWFNNIHDIDPVIKSAIAHFWFVTIHPFDDGNGRIARAIADMQLARSEGTCQRFYSMSSQILKERKTYYDILEKCQKGGLDITNWIEWFLICMRHAITASEEILRSILIKAQFWDNHASHSLNSRQQLIINKLLDSFDGKLTSSKWAKICGCSQDTALRDINDLLERNILSKDTVASGRSTSYNLVIDL